MNRRAFVKASVLASAGVSASIQSAPTPSPATTRTVAGPAAGPRTAFPSGKIGDIAFSRLMLGGNLISGYAHARDLMYVAHLMKRYNTDAKILETLEVAEAHGIDTINSWVQDGIGHLQEHWRRGGRMKWIAQARLNPNGNLDQFKRAADLGAVAIHVTGDVADALVSRGEVETIARIVSFIREQKCLAGVGAHGLNTILACEDANLNPDFYVKTLHTREYHSAPDPGETGDLGRYDNSWCKDAEEVVDAMFSVQRPWIAFKVLAAGAIPPRRGFRYAFESGADFVLAGMFDWQIAEDVEIARETLAGVQRLRPWRG